MVFASAWISCDYPNGRAAYILFASRRGSPTALSLGVVRLHADYFDRCRCRVSLGHGALERKHDAYVTRRKNKLHDDAAR